MDQSRVQAASGDAEAGCAPRAGGEARGAAPATDSTDSAETAKYVAAADANLDGTVSAEEEAAYKKLQAAAEARAQTQVQAYKDVGDMDTQANLSAVEVSA
jgi:hypothetical protein